MPCQFPALKVLLIVAVAVLVYWLAIMAICTIAWAVGMVRRAWRDDWEDVL